MPVNRPLAAGPLAVALWLLAPATPPVTAQSLMQSLASPADATTATAQQPDSRRAPLSDPQPDPQPGPQPDPQPGPPARPRRAASGAQASPDPSRQRFFEMEARDGSGSTVPSGPPAPPPDPADRPAPAEAGESGPGVPTPGADSRGPGTASDPAGADTDAAAPSRRRPAAAATPAPAAPPRDAPDWQDAGSADSATGTPDASSRVDTTALRYFVAQGDARRARAEIARLQALHPDWDAPADPLSLPASGDRGIDAMWELFAEGRIAELAQTIAERREREPDWTPPDALASKLALAKARERLINASDIRQFGTVLEIAADHEALLTCADPEALWRVAEAFAETGRTDRAGDVYGFVLRTCSDPDLHLATIQKASRRLDRTAVERLMEIAPRRVAGSRGRDGFAEMRLALARQALVAAAADTAIGVSDADLARIEDAFEEAPNADDARLLGWYRLRRDQFPPARTWFRRALDIAPTASAGRGLALAQLRSGAFVAAEATAHAWLGESRESRDVYMAVVANLLSAPARDRDAGGAARHPGPPALPRCAPDAGARIRIADDVLARMAREIMAASDRSAAQQMGWYAYAFRQYPVAARWFSTALDWRPDTEPSAYGLALTLRRMNRDRDVARIQRIWKDRSQRIAALGESCPAAPRTSRLPQPRPATVPTDGYLPRAYRAGAAGAAMAAAPGAQDSAAPDSHSRSAEVMRGPRSGSPLRATKPSPEHRTSATQCRHGARSRAALAAGWCLMEVQRPMQAARAFGKALASDAAGLRSDAAYGRSLAYLRLGLVDEAAIAATRAPQSRARRDELQAAILAARAGAAFEKGAYAAALRYLDRRRRLAPARIDLMLLRGYAHHRLGQNGDARRLFRSAARAGSPEARKGLDLATQTQLERARARRD